uniref:Uncharacterized protein n=1 Tax=Physcomitrium patens TaxID=3218 RepID=A0A7I4E1P0_PHYPA
MASGDLIVGSHCPVGDERWGSGIGQSLWRISGRGGRRGGVHYSGELWNKTNWRLPGDRVWLLSEEEG